jgi:hypothetical protein
VNPYTVETEEAQVFERTLKYTNWVMIAIDFGFGVAALVAPRRTMHFFGHDEPTKEAEHLFRNSAGMWLTFGAAHTVAAARGSKKDWWALAWLRTTEMLINGIWFFSPSVKRLRPRFFLFRATFFNLLLALGFRALARSKES